MTFPKFYLNRSELHSANTLILNDYLTTNRTNAFFLGQTSNLYGFSGG